MTHTRRRRLTATFTTALSALVGFATLATADALRAAGLNGVAPPNAAGFKTFISTMTDNAVWIVGTTTVLAVVVVGSLFLFGHSRAQDLAMKIGLGVSLIILAPGIGS